MPNVMPISNESAARKLDNFAAAVVCYLMDGSAEALAEVCFTLWQRGYLRDCRTVLEVAYRSPVVQAAAGLDLRLKCTDGPAPPTEFRRALDALLEDLRGPLLDEILADVEREQAEADGAFVADVRRRIAAMSDAELEAAWNETERQVIIREEHNAAG